MSEERGFDAKRIALVMAYDPATTDFATATPEVATGYFLTGDLVLTVRHVTDRRDAAFRVRSEVDSGYGHFADAKPVWRGVGDVDALLLRTTAAFGDWALPDFADEIDPGPWVSQGFAKGAADPETGRRKTLPLKGSVDLSGGQGPPELDLGTERHVSAGQHDYWQGVSGAPVFSPATGTVLGIVTDASKKFANMLVGMPASRLYADIEFVSAVSPSFLGSLPATDWCLVLTAEQSVNRDLVGRVDEVLRGLRAKEAGFRDLHEAPVHLDVLDAVASVANWIATIRALAHADYLVADVTGFEPAVMLLLGIRSVLRRGVTVSVSAAEPGAVHGEIPFNVQETRVLHHEGLGFHDDLRRALAQGRANLVRDTNYLDLPAFHGVRSPRPETWAAEDQDDVLVLCPFSKEYSTYFDRTLRNMIDSYAGATPRRMLDLRSPRLVGQALYEQIRWASRCLVDWTQWRPNVFFELGVRLACAESDPLCVIDTTDARSKPGRTQEARLRTLLGPIEYDRADPSAARKVLRPALESWSAGSSSAPDRLSPGGTFRITQESIYWETDSMLDRPHVEQRRGAEQILGKDLEQRPEKLVLFADNERFYTALRAAAREKWISAWLYLRHLCPGDEDRDSARWRELIDVSRLTENALRSSEDPRHVELRTVIGELLLAHTSRGEPFPKTLETVLALKASAKSARNDGDLRLALEELGEAVELLEDELTMAEEGSTLHSRLTAELADSFGMIGGVERRWGLVQDGDDRRRRLKRSVAAYDRGFSSEAGLARSETTTYNRINRLVGRVMIDPDVLTGSTMRRDLQEAEEIVAEQLASTRQKDPWCWSDLATIRLLRGADAWTPINELDRLRPQRFVYESAITTLESLAEVASDVRPDLAAAVVRMRSLARYAQ